MSAGGLSPKDQLPIGEVARRSGYAASALRYYEQEGLITSERTPGGRRTFSRHVLRRLAFIRAAQNVGLSLDVIRDELATLPSDKAPNKADWEKISRRWQKVLNEHIAAAEQLRDTLTSCIGCGCLSLASCALYNKGDELASHDDLPGAKRWSSTLRVSQ